MITNFFAKAAATGGHQTQDGTGPVVDSLLGARTSVLPTGHIEMDAGLLAVGGVQDSLATPKTPNKSDDKVTSGNGSTTNPLNRRPPPRSRVNKRTNKAKPTKGKTRQVEKGLQQIDKMFQIETRAPSASQPRAVLADRNEVTNQGIGRSAGTSERPQVSPTRDHGKSEPMHVPYDSFYPEDQENWDWGVMIPSKPRPRSKYAELLRPDWMKRDANEVQVSKSTVEHEASDEERFFDWSSSPPRPGRREAEEGRESLYTQKRAPAEVGTEQFADESSDGELSELDSDQFDAEFEDDEVVDSDIDSEVDSDIDSENKRPEGDDNEWEDIEEEEDIGSEPLDIDEFPPRRPNESHERYVYRVLNLEPDDVEARQIIFRYRLEGIIRHTWTLARQTPLENVANNSPFIRPVWSILAHVSEEKIDEAINKIERAIIPVVRTIFGGTELTRNEVLLLPIIMKKDQLKGVYLDLVTNTRVQKDNGLYVGSAVSVPKKWVGKKGRTFSRAGGVHARIVSHRSSIRCGKVKSKHYRYIRARRNRRPNFRLVAQFPKSVDPEISVEDANWMVILLENTTIVMAGSFEPPNSYPSHTHGPSIERFVADLGEFTIPSAFEPLNRALPISQPLHPDCRATHCANCRKPLGVWNPYSHPLPGHIFEKICHKCHYRYKKNGCLPPPDFREQEAEAKRINKEARSKCVNCGLEMATKFALAHPEEGHKGEYICRGCMSRYTRDKELPPPNWRTDGSFGIAKVKPKVKPKVDRRCSKCGKTIPASVPNYRNPDDRSQVWCRNCKDYWNTHRSGKMVSQQKKLECVHCGWNPAHPDSNKDAWNILRHNATFGMILCRRCAEFGSKHSALPIVWRQVKDLPDFECEGCKVTRSERWTFSNNHGVTKLLCHKCCKGTHDGIKKTFKEYKWGNDVFQAKQSSQTFHEYLKRVANIDNSLEAIRARNTENEGGSN